MQNFSFLINGESVFTPTAFDVLNPADETVLAACPAASESQVDLSVRSAHAAFLKWRTLTAKQRGQYLIRASETLATHLKPLAILLSQEQGKPLANAIVEVESAIARLASSAQLSLPVDVAFEDDQCRMEIHHKPLGVVAVITPWNLPVKIAVGRLCSALMAGNTVVIKPSPYTPLSTLKLGELCRDIFPHGVVNIIAGKDGVGEWLTNHPLVKKISFTGSVPTGKAIAAVAAKSLKRVTLELGGNDAAIVLDDANIEKVAEPIFWGAFSNTGQICIAIKRLYVHESLFDALVSKLKSIAEQIKLGPGLDPETQLGPLNNQAQLQIVTDLVADASQQGATIITGGQRLNRPGYFYQPTLVTNIQEGVRLVDEEQFGPVLPIMSYASLEEVIQRANATELGLGASVWGEDLSRAQAVALQLESGTAWVNEALALNECVPFGGVKQSGIGRELGEWGLAELTEPQSIIINKL